MRLHSARDPAECAKKNYFVFLLLRTSPIPRMDTIANAAPAPTVSLHPRPAGLPVVVWEEVVVVVVTAAVVVVVATGSAGMVSFSTVCLHSVHSLCFAPSTPSEASLSIIQSPGICAETSAFSPQEHSCQWFFSSLLHSDANL